MARVSASAWEEFIASHPEAHILQTAAWGELKAAFGWKVERVLFRNAGAQVLFRRLPFGASLAYIPKGPVGNAADWEGLFAEIDSLCRARRAVFLKVEPDFWEEEGGAPLPQGFVNSHHAIQPRRTILVSLEGDEGEILARMKQKTRYNIRLAARKGVTVRQWDDVGGFYRLMLETAQRDGFGVHPEAYYRLAYQLFAPRGEVALLVAEFEGEPLAALMAFARGPRAWYFYGASTGRHRNKMPTYLLQWEAMRWARARACKTYDLWGVPDAPLEQLEAEFTKRRDGLWGVYRFKRGFGGVLRRAPVWDKPYFRPGYWLYRALTKGTTH